MPYCTTLQCWQNTDDGYCIDCKSVNLALQNRVSAYDFSSDSFEVTFKKCYDVFHYTDATWQKLLNAKQVCDIVFALWGQNPLLTPTLDKFLAFAAATESFFVPLQQEVLKSFNERNNTNYDALKFVPPHLVNEQDLKSMNDAYPFLLEKHEGTVVMENVMKACVNATAVLTNDEIMRTLLNTCIHFRKHGHATSDMCLQKVPKLSDVRDLNLGSGLMESIKHLCSDD